MLPFHNDVIVSKLKFIKSYLMPHKPQKTPNDTPAQTQVINLNSTSA